MAISGALNALIHHRRSLSEAETEQALEAILTGGATIAEIAAFLVALHLKGETSEELTGAARALRRLASTPPYDTASKGPLVDTCGTGGDRSGTFNISTLAAFVVAGAGIPVAKHGNRSLSSTCGSADLLEALGVNLEHAAHALPTAGIAFFFAPLFHGATRSVQPIRAELKIRTLFNYLGPLTNPAGANIQVAGAFSKHAARLIAQSLAALGLPRGFVVHGEDGLDEVTTTSQTAAYKIQDGDVHELIFTPEDFGLPRAEPSSLLGGTVQDNHRIALALLDGERGPKRDIVLANAALAIHAASSNLSIQDSVHAAERSIDSGKAREKLSILQQFRFANSIVDYIKFGH